MRGQFRLVLIGVLFFSASCVAQVTTTTNCTINGAGSNSAIANCNSTSFDQGAQNQANIQAAQQAARQRTQNAENIGRGIGALIRMGINNNADKKQFDVVQQTAISSSQGQTVPVQQPVTPSSPCPAGMHRVPTSYGSYCEADAPSPLQTTLAVSSTPLGAEIELDGNFIGDTPSTVSVSGADHSIKLTKAGYVPWERILKTSSGTVTVAPELVSVASTQTGK